MTGHKKHNEQVPIIVKQIVRTSATEAEAFAILESVVLGIAMFYRPDVREAGEFLDTLTAAVIERMNP